MPELTGDYMSNNENIIETSHDLDALIRAVKIHPTESMVQKIIDKEIDCNGNHCEPAFCAFIWRKVFHVQPGAFAP